MGGDPRRSGVQGLDSGTTGSRLSKKEDSDRIAKLVKALGLVRLVPQRDRTLDGAPSQVCSIRRWTKRRALVTDLQSSARIEGRSRRYARTHAQTAGKQSDPDEVTNSKGLTGEPS
jgi:hypothetical protein